MCKSAKEIFQAGGYSLVITGNGETVVSYGLGIAPLMELIESGKNFKGCFAADKIVGKAAALLYAHMGVAEVYAEVLSVAAEKVLLAYDIHVSYSVLTDKIINRKGDGICPMEIAVADVEFHEEAFAVLREKAGKRNK